MTNLIGHSFGRYHILEQLGEGGMATVYKAFDTRLERNVAIKVILPGKQHSEKFIKRFEREAKALARLSHPNIVGVIDYGEQDGMPYLVMEYLPGGTLKHKLTGKPTPWQEAARILIPIAHALGYAHQNKIVHRDVKPSNILITQTGEPMLSDFGIAKILETEETLDLTGTGVGVGTPEYMSPEQAQGKQVDARSDIYSLGIVLYEMVTGRKPYQADTPMAVVWKLASEPLPRPKQFARNLPDFIEAILLKTLSKTPGDRYQSMGEMATVLEEADSGAEVRYSKPKAMLNKKRFLVAGLTIITILALLAIIFLPRTTSSIPGIVTLGAPEITNTNNSQIDRTYLAAEDFEDGQVQMVGFSAEPTWEIIDDGTGNEVYQVDNKLDNRVGDSYVGFTFGAEEWSDYATEFRVKLLNEAADFGLQVRSDTISNYYVVDFSTSFLYLAYSTPKEWVRITTSYPPIQTNLWHTVRVDLQGDRIQVYVDGSRWVDEHDSRYSHGEVMFFASPGTYAQVDDIKVWEEEDKDTIRTNVQFSNPTETTIPGSKVLYSEDFEDGRAKNINYIYGDWEVAFENNTNKVYEIDNKNNPDYAGIDIGSTTWKNFEVQYRVKMLHHTTGAPEVILYFRTNSDGSDGYVQALTPYWNDVLLAKHIHGSSWQGVINHSFSFDLEKWYYVKVQADGPKIKVFVNDKLLLERIDTQFSSGALTFQVGPGAHVMLDDINVTELK